VMAQASSGVPGYTTTGLVSPGAVKLADLNNDGTLDLIVLDSGGNDVLVYPGLGNGKFGQALNDGYGFATGTDPVGITVADLTGNGRPDLIIANQGSNDISILINVKVGNSFTFVPGPRLKAGIGPTSTVVADVLGNGLPDILVSNSGSNDVWLLPGLGNGFFNDQTPTIYPVGTDPGALFVGQFTGGSGQDLVTVNSGSDNVTVISGLGTTSPTFQSVSTGGVDPIAAFEADVMGNGQDSLIVANNGDGNIALLSGGDNGLSLSSVLSSAGLPNPSGLALASFGGGNVEFYATTEGEESASLLGFQLEESSTSSASVSVSTSGASLQLLSLNESSLALVGTLLTVTLELQNETEQTSESATAEVGSAGPGAAGQSLLAFNRSPEVSELLEESSAQPTGAAAPNPLSWARYVTGVDQAIETLRDEADRRLLEEQLPAKAEEPGSTLLKEDAGARQTGSAASLEPAVSAVNRRSAPKPDRWKAIDAALGSLAQEVDASYRSLLAATLRATVTQSISFVPHLVELNGFANLIPRLDDDRSQRVEIQVSRAAALVAISVTAGKLLENRLRRSVPGLVIPDAGPTPRRPVRRMA